QSRKLRHRPTRRGRAAARGANLARTARLRLRDADLRCILAVERCRPATSSYKRIQRWPARTALAHWSESMKEDNLDELVAPPAEQGPNDDRPTIDHVGGELPNVVCQSPAALLTCMTIPRVYQRGPQLVITERLDKEIADGKIVRPAGSLVITTIKPERMVRF